MNTTRALTLLALAGLMLGPGAYSAGSGEKLCATLEDAAGRLQILDTHRTRVLDSQLNVAIPCGAWLSVDTGFARLRHRDGSVIGVRPGTYLGLPDPGVVPAIAEGVVLIRGEVMLTVQDGAAPLQVVTANGRARVQEGRALVIYLPQDQETQLVALESSAELENRFESGSRITVRTGESTSLSLKLERSVPETPRVVAMAEVRSRLAPYSLPEREQFKILESVRDRNERRFAHVLRGDRAPASLSAVRPSGPYERHPPGRRSASQNKAAEKAWLQRDSLGGLGDDAGDFLYPQATRGPASEQARRRKLEVQELIPEGERLQALERDRERKRLLEELSRISTE